MTELHGHGDPLLSVAMKDNVILKAKEDATTGQVVDHSAGGHGDPLFQEALGRSPPKAPLHKEFEGHGDPLMEEVEKTWEGIPAEKKNLNHHDVVHTEFQSHGDPLLKEHCKPAENYPRDKAAEKPPNWRSVFGF